jgi:hypothetical protein
MGCLRLGHQPDSWLVMQLSSDAMGQRSSAQVEALLGGRERVLVITRAVGARRWSAAGQRWSISCSGSKTRW